MTLRAGHLFAGYDGLGMAVEAIWPDSEIAWFSDVCKFDKDGKAGHHEPHRAPCSILAHHYPDVPNLGDVTAVDWAQVEPVDILTGGSPCQDLSHAGKRAGMTEGTRSNLWVAMREAIAQLRPGLVIWENVRGAYSAAADSDMEPCAGCLGDGSDEPALRALGRVLGDLSELGYVGGWHGLRAADVGAPHGRFRVFVVAYAASDTGRFQYGDDTASGHASGIGRQRRQAQLARTLIESAGHGTGSLLPTPRVGGLGDNPSERRRNSPGLEVVLNTLPTPTARDWKNVGDPDKTAARMADRGQPLGEVVVNALLPTPAVNDMGAAYTPDEWDAWTDRMKAEHDNGNGHGKSLSIEAQRLLPTPIGGSNAGNADNRKSPGYDNGGENYHEIIAADRWGEYAEAVARWEQVTRLAPDPTELGSKGTPRLAPTFSEWMMGLPAGWVTDVPEITRNEALKALGNGVVPAQCEAAVRYILRAIEAVA